MTKHGSPEHMTFDVLDNNGEVLESTGLWWVAAQSARFHGFRVRDNDDDSIQADFRRDDCEE